MSIFSTGLSGLNAAQNALAATSNNISNIFTPGYNREVAILSESGNGGNGVQVEDIQRQFNRYIADQLNAATSKTSALETYTTQVEQIDSLLADREAGLAPLMQDFFSSLEDLASAPSDPAARQGVLGSAQTLSAQFRSFDGYLQDMQEGINGQIEDEVTQINNTTKQLAGINREIALARAKQGEAPNSLLNQRDQLVHDLSERLDVRLNIQDGKTYNVSLPNGQPLVSGERQFALETMEAPNDPQRTVLGYRDSGGNVVALDEDVVSGGTLGGLMRFRDETLDKTQNQIGQMAVSLAVAFNQQHANGVDLDGEQGAAFFDIGQPRAFSAKDNDGSATVTDTAFDTANIDQLGTSDYRVRITNAPPSGPADFEVTRLDGGGTLEAADLAFDDPNGNGTDATLSFGGVTLTFDDTNNLAQNDRFEVQPVRRAAADLEAAITDLDDIAAGSLVHGDTGAIAEFQAEPGNALASGNAPWRLSVTDTGGGTFEIVAEDDTGATQTFTGQESGDAITVDGITLTLGDLEDGQTLTLDADASGSGDNRNALAMQDIQQESVVGGSASLSGAYGSMVSDVGNRTNIAQVNLESQQGLSEQLRAVQQSESGVNLDEEAANLIRYQQYYQANAKVIEAGRTMLDTVLGLRN
ncbi:flagellar hook-associated protein FlgK [Halomonas koreensis]|uniref:Flagellar hook-associated protein 1 n=1 Tax=Halomonas koreensis TaxID=245385 RepID=A0ABU1G156_9GAMM|nr:flagellar hook-associated protein FlgK [Halomonas koreensis]MDR5866461.1 flagellar hook-associated protein FlgK [Halomonas koreensis]